MSSQKTVRHNALHTCTAHTENKDYAKLSPAVNNKHIDAYISTNKTFTLIYLTIFDLYIEAI